MKPKISSGTRDFGAIEISKRRYITDIISQVFTANAYNALETPAFEQLTTLTGKYGEEGEKLMFKILNNGLNEKADDKKAKLNEDFGKHLDTGNTTPTLTERALKYDLTIPFARHVVLNHNLITLPFKRYQMQPVWRADRPQKGRYREFWQCDADVVGVTSLTYDAELIVMYDDVFERLGITATQLCLNNRKILAGLADKLGLGEKLTEFTITLDKLDKIGWETVSSQLTDMGAETQYLDAVYKIMQGPLQNRQKIDALKELGTNTTMETGLVELSLVLDYIEAYKKDTYTQVVFDLSLARGLDYYTGMIVEVKNENAPGSLGGGGRYDELTAVFGLKDVPGVGISFGLDRIYNLMEEQELFPPDILPIPDLLVYAPQPLQDSLATIAQWRRQGLVVDALYQKTKIDKVYKRAEQQGIRHVCIWAQDTTPQAITYKNIVSGEKYNVDNDTLIQNLKN